MTLAVGESRTVRFIVTAESLALYDAGLRRVVEPGTFTIYVGGNSESVEQVRLLVTGDLLVLEPPPTRAR